MEHLTELPANLAMTELGVRPCVAWLRATVNNSANDNNSTSGGATGASDAQRPLDPARDLLPKLDAKEVAAVFTAPFHNFLSH